MANAEIAQQIITLKRLVGRGYKTRNFYLTTGGPRKDRKDLIQRHRDYVRNNIKVIRMLETV